VPAPDSPDSPVTVERVPAVLTRPLRHEVLRPGQPASAVATGTDEHPDAAAFAARTPGGEVVGTVIVAPEPCPWRPDDAGAWRLRGMATAPERRGQGIGTRVLAAAVDHVRAAGGTLIWCNARTPARTLYERAGFTAHGDEWIDPVIGPHVAMWRRL